MENIRVEINEQGRKQIVVPATKAYAIFIKWAAEKHGVKAPKIQSGAYRWDMPWWLVNEYPFDEERERERERGYNQEEITAEELEKSYWYAMEEFFTEDWDNGANGREMDIILWEILRDDAQYRVSEYEEKEAGLRR